MSRNVDVKCVHVCVCTCVKVREHKEGNCTSVRVALGKRVTKHHIYTCIREVSNRDTWLVSEIGIGNHNYTLV